MTKKIILTMILAFIIALSWGYLLARASFSKSNALTKQKYYSSLQLNSGDSLWKIASDFADPELISYDSYVRELKKINRLKSDRVHAGQYLTYFYYSEDHP